MQLFSHPFPHISSCSWFPTLTTSLPRRVLSWTVAGLFLPLLSPLIDVPTAGIVPEALAQSAPSADSRQDPKQDPTVEPDFDDSAENSPAIGVRPNKNCDFRQAPPRPVDKSEEPGPDGVAPAPLPVASPTPGGDKLADCGEILADGFVVPKEQSASAWAVVDLDSGEVLATKDPHGRYRPASTIKVLLALVALDELELDKKIKASAEAANAEGSAAGIGPDGEYTIEQLLFGLLLNSGNDCAAALVEELGGTERAVELVNAKATQLGATDTRVVNVSGLDGPGMSSSAYDLSLFYKAAFSNPDFQRMVQTRTVKFPGWGKNKGFDLYSDNGLLGWYDGAIGGKTGFTDSARHTFYGAAERDGRRLGVIVLDTTIFHGRAYEQAARFLDAGFATPPGNNVGQLELDYNNASSSETFRAAGPGSPESDNPGLRPSIEKAAPWALLVGLVLVVGYGMRRTIARSRQ